MKKAFCWFAPISLVIFISACGSAGQALQVENPAKVSGPAANSLVYAVSTKGDEIDWEGFKTYNSNSHTGTLQVSEGHFEVSANRVTGGTFIIDMNTIANTDLDDNFRPKLEGHLKSEDFFYVEAYPTAEFKITEVTDTMDVTGQHYVKGNLKIKGVEKGITIPARIKFEGDTLIFETPEFVIDRTKWNVMYASTKEEWGGRLKEQLIDDNIVIRVVLKAHL